MKTNFNMGQAIENDGVTVSWIPSRWVAKDGEAEELLAYVDIVSAIRYYGITELLDAIGEENLRLHLENLKPISAQFNV